jgi:hypothetical protein
VTDRGHAAKEILGQLAAQARPTPRSFTFGDGIEWSSPLNETLLYVELPFWLMTPPGTVAVEWCGTTFPVDICSPWMEVFVVEVTDSRASCIHQGPWRDDYVAEEYLPTELSEEDLRLLARPTKTVLRLTTRGHAGAFRELAESEPPRARHEQKAYWASLCEAHIPVVNELIQRYRLVTYDFFPYEVSAWDVPIWYLKHGGAGYRAMLLSYKEWDRRPVVVERLDENGLPVMKPFEWATPHALGDVSSELATPGEFDLLDARSLMERGDYTGAVRRTVTAIEAVLEWALLGQLKEQYSPAEAATKLENTKNNFPGRLAQWRKLAQPAISQSEFDELESTRQLRHDIVHRARRILQSERGRAQRAVDTSRWLFNKIEGKPERAAVREKGPGVIRSVGRVALTPRFPAGIEDGGIVLHPLT